MPAALQTALTQALLLLVSAAAPPLLAAALCALLLGLLFGRTFARGPLLTVPCLAAGLLGLVLSAPMIGQAFTRFLTSILLLLPQLRAG